MWWNLDTIITVLHILGSLVFYGSVEATFVVFGVFAVSFGINFSFHYLLNRKGLILFLALGLVLGIVSGAFAWWVSSPLDLESRPIASIVGPVLWTSLTVMFVYVGNLLAKTFEKTLLAYAGMGLGALTLTCSLLIVTFGSHLESFV